jgi:SecD/SecF fusion protein
MTALSLLPQLLAADNRLLKVDIPTIAQIPGMVWLVLVLIAASFGLGILLANSLRLRDYGWKIGLILATLSASLAIVLFGQFKLGVDLQGGVILVYEVNEAESSDDWQMSRLVQVLRDRLNTTGLKEIVVRPFGPKQVEIVVPEADEEAIDQIKERITTGGMLQFMIVASELRDGLLFETARDQAANPVQEERIRRDIVDGEGNKIGFWATVGREVADDPSTAPLRDPSVVEGLVRDSRSGQILDLSASQRAAFRGNPDLFIAYLNQQGIKQVDALMVFDPEYDIRGDQDLGPTTPGRDSNLSPCIFFSMRGEGIYKMSNLTGQNLERKLAIIFDNELKSAPVIRAKISERGEITGEFTEDEVNFMVEILKSGSLPVVLHKNPISENQIGAILGLDTIRSGSYATAWSLIGVLVFMALYYRLAGIVAGFALTLNLLLTVAFMVMFQAPFTLPGLAGLVLTVGMSVDANVLIFERIREEQNRGATLRMSIRNGFERALSAIIDGNLTTLLTAIVLYAIGTDQVRGFGATLILGNLTSMFTAIFCSRVILDVLEKTRAVKQLSMTQLLSPPSFDWCKYLVPAMVASSILIAIGLAATVARGRGIFDIDLAGGTSVTFILKEPTSDADVRKKLAVVFDDLVNPETNARVDYSVNEVKVQAEPAETVYKVDSSLPEVDALQENIRKAFMTDGQEGLRTFAVSIGEISEEMETPAEKPAADAPPTGNVPATVPPTGTVPATEPSGATPTSEAPATAEPATPEPATAEPAPAATETPAPTPVEPPAEQPAAGPAVAPPTDEASSCQDEPAPAPQAEPVVATADSAQPASEPAEPAATEPPANPTPTSETPADAPEAATTPAGVGPGAPESTAPEPTPSEATSPAAASPEGATPPSSIGPSIGAPRQISTVTLDFPNSAITAESLRKRIVESASKSLGRDPDILEINNPDWDGRDNSAFEKWTVKFALSPAQTQQIVAGLKSELEHEVVWQTSSKIGGQVSVDTRWKAITAITVSLLGIMAYVWFRFHQASWGIAAIVALAHDALVMLGGIGISYWLVSSFGWLQIEEFKISLPVVAAFLTLIGYSVNDTIVIFDRIREIRGKSPNLTRQMINDALNQTLSRTIITGGLTLLVCLVLYFFGGSGIHAFAFALVVGVISGTYSTVFIAAPILLWLIGKPAAAPAPSSTGREMAKTSA